MPRAVHHHLWLQDVPSRPNTVHWDGLVNEGRAPPSRTSSNLLMLRCTGSRCQPRRCGGHPGLTSGIKRTGGRGQDGDSHHRLIVEVRRSPYLNGGLFAVEDTRVAVGIEFGQQLGIVWTVFGDAGLGCVTFGF